MSSSIEYKIKPFEEKRSLRNRNRTLQYTELSSDEEDDGDSTYNFENDSTQSTSETLTTSTRKRHRYSGRKANEITSEITSEITTDSNNPQLPSSTNVNNTTTSEDQIADPSHIGHIEEAKLFDKDSPLGHLDFKLMIPTWINQLPQEQLTQLLTLLPAADKRDENTLDPDFLANSNRILWDAVQQWEDTLLSGGLSQNKIQSPLNGAARFKDENYERYWGERLEKNRSQKEDADAAAATATTERGRGRGRRRGRGRGRGTGTGAGTGAGRKRGRPSVKDSESRVDSEGESFVNK